MAFIHHAPSQKPPQKTESRIKKRPNVRWELLRSFDHCLTVFMEGKPGVKLNCLQSINLPMSPAFLASFKRSRRVDIYFNSSDKLSFCFEKADTREKHVVTAIIPYITYLLYGITTTSFRVYGSVLHSNIQLEVCVRDAAILKTRDVVQYGVCQSQFDKIFSFLTLQFWDEEKKLESLRLPIFEQLSENQDEFISSTIAIYSVIQQLHTRDALVWNLKELKQPSEVKIQLLPYQLEAVRWMVYRERNVQPPVNPDLIYRYFLKLSEDNLFFSALSGQ